MSRRQLAIVLAVLYLPLAMSCNIRSRADVAPSQARPGTARTSDLVLQAVRIDGSIVNFDRPGARVLGDSIIGKVAKVPLILPVADVTNVTVSRYNATQSGVASFIVAIPVILVIAAGIALASSCPFVYSWDGEQWVFDAEPHGGAVTAGLERADVSELEHIAATDGRYQVMFVNEMPETQHTDLAELWVADHPAGTRPVRDEHGGLRLVRGPIAPRSARDDAGKDLLPALSRRDASLWNPDPGTQTAGTRHEIIVTFPRPAGSSRASLVTDAATSTWGAGMLSTMLSMRGRDVGAWYAAIDGDSTSRSLLEQWNLREELWVLGVDVQTATGWTRRALIGGGGPFSSETQSTTLDLDGVIGDSVRIRLRPPTGYWAINSIAMDFGSAAGTLAVDTLRAIEARDLTRGDIGADVARIDGRRYVMPATGDQAVLTFKAPPLRPGMTRTVFLHSRGFYRIHLPENNTPDYQGLQRLADRPGAAAELAVERFRASRPGGVRR